MARRSKELSLSSLRAVVIASRKRINRAGHRHRQIQAWRGVCCTNESCARPGDAEMQLSFRAKQKKTPRKKPQREQLGSNMIKKNPCSEDSDVGQSSENFFENEQNGQDFLPAPPLTSPASTSHSPRPHHHRSSTHQHLYPNMLFCPTCANCLIIQLDDHGNNKWSCHTCPYEFPIVRQMTTRQHLKRKEVDDVMGGEESWKNVDSTDAPCPKCENPKAFFMQLQIRSADEPMTTFYRCTNGKCAYQWKEN